MNKLIVLFNKIVLRRELKPVFSCKLYIEERISRGVSCTEYLWPKECDGLTEKQMNAKCFCTHDDWMVERFVRIEK